MFLIIANQNAYSFMKGVQECGQTLWTFYESFKGKVKFVTQSYKTRNKSQDMFLSY